MRTTRVMPLYSEMPIVSAVELPQGFRRITRAEYEALDNTQSVLLYDKTLKRISRWHLTSYNGSWEFWRAVLKSDGQVVDTVRLHDLDDDAQGLPSDAPVSVEPEFYVVVMPESDTDVNPFIRQGIYALEADDILTEVRCHR